MRILILNYRDIKHPLAGGAEVHLHRIFGRIASWGHSVRLVTTSFPGAPEQETIDGIEVLRLGRGLLFQWLLTRRLSTIIQEFNPDVLVEDVNKRPFFTVFFNKIPKLIQIHKLWGFSIFHEASFPIAFLIWAQEHLLGIAYKGNTFAAVSPSTVSELEALGIPSRDIHLVYNGSEQDWGDLELQREKGTYFLWLGLLSKYKGVWVALHAFRKVAAKLPEIKLVFAGAGPEEKSMRAAVTKWGLQDRVEIRGRVSAEEKRDLLRGALALIQSSFKEGWGLTVIEAGICGTLSIASRVPGLRDSVRDGETGILFTAGESSELAGQMIRVVNNPDERRGMEAGARAFAMGFSWEKSAAQTLEILQSIQSGKKS
ncbi:MAG TPA: glycosyltransferase family 4 protein [Fibrobacteraceae bacterium]|nr:glycosyltransferase family 4 protein [Fibrobacteraceae bacterium]